MGEQMVNQWPEITAPRQSLKCCQNLLPSCGIFCSSLAEAHLCLFWSGHFQPLIVYQFWLIHPFKLSWESLKTSPLTKNPSVIEIRVLRNKALLDYKWFQKLSFSKHLSCTHIILFNSINSRSPFQISDEEAKHRKVMYLCKMTQFINDWTGIWVSWFQAHDLKRPSWLCDFFICKVRIFINPGQHKAQAAGKFLWDTRITFSIKCIMHEHMWSLFSRQSLLETA